MYGMWCDYSITSIVSDNNAINDELYSILYIVYFLALFLSSDKNIVLWYNNIIIPPPPPPPGIIRTFVSISSAYILR